MGCTSRLLPSLLLFLRELKKRHPEKTVILGGPGPTGLAEQVLEFSPADIVVRGEAEQTIVEVMECLTRNRPLDGVKGITYRDAGRIITNPGRPRIRDLDEIPFPAYDAVDINKYKVGIITSRGCPYKCGFCYRGLWGDEVKFRSVDNVIEEIKLIKEKFGKNSIYVYDDVFPLKEKRVFDFCDKLGKEGIDLRWYCWVRVDLMNERIMKKISENGCYGAHYGIESGSDRILKLINKGFTVKKAEDVIQKSKKYLEQIVASSIWGFPFETVGDLKKSVKITEKFLFRLNIDGRLHLLSPHVGTPIYEKHKGEIIPYETPKGIAFLDENLFDTFKSHPEIALYYYRYKTPGFNEKMKIVEDFEKRQNFHNKIKE